MTDPRLERLRVLRADIEQAPPSSERDDLLRAVRDRITTLETGREQSPWGTKDPEPELAREFR